MKSTYKLSEIGKIFGINNGDKLVNSLHYAVKEVIYIKRKTGGPLSLLQVKKRLLSRM